MRGVAAIMMLGLGNFMGQLCFSIIAVIVNKNLVIYGTDIDIAVYGILSRIHVFITMPLIGLSQGFQPIAGYNYGAGDMKRVKDVTILSVGVSIAIGIAVMIFPVAFPETFISLFTDEAALIAAGVDPLRITLMFLPLIGIQIIGFSFFQAIGDPVRTIIVSLSRQFIFLIPLLILLPGAFSMTGIWAAFPVADASAIVLSLMMMILSGRRYSTSLEISLGGVE
jgi:Na+-driven multidrug efflux pump